jgi:Carboxypeptidase regulatory-like domain
LRKVLLVCVFLLPCLFLASSLYAQSNYAIVSGRVLDQQNLPVAGAKVSFRATRTDEVREVTTNDQGLFEAAALTPGEYEVKATAEGFSTTVQTLRVEVGQRVEMPISLRLGPIQQNAKVTDAADVLRTTDASVGEVVEPKSVRELPLNGRMLIDLVLAVPLHSGHRPAKYPKWPWHRALAHPVLVQKYFSHLGKFCIPGSIVL